MDPTFTQDLIEWTLVYRLSQNKVWEKLQEMLLLVGI